MFKIVKGHKRFNSIELEIMLLVVILGIIALIAKPVYKKYLIIPKASIAPQILFEVIDHVEEYTKNNTGERPV